MFYILYIFIYYKSIDRCDHIGYSIDGWFYMMLWVWYGVLEYYFVWHNSRYLHDGERKQWVLTMSANRILLSIDDPSIPYRLVRYREIKRTSNNDLLTTCQTNIFKKQPTIPMHTESKIMMGFWWNEKMMTERRELDNVFWVSYKNKISWMWLSWWPDISEEYSCMGIDFVMWSMPRRWLWIGICLNFFAFL